MVFALNRGTPELRKQFPIGARVEEIGHEYMKGTVLGYGTDPHTITPSPIVAVRWDGKWPIPNESWNSPSSLRKVA